MKVLVIGANGRIGRRLVARLAQSGTPVRAMVRSEDQRADLEGLGAEVVIGDLENDFEHALDGCDAVVFTAGSGAHTGPDKTFVVDLWGAIKTIRSCEQRQISRYIMISARNAGDPDRGTASRKPYLIAKHLADDALMRSTLGYTILRPGRLTDESGTGHVRTSRPPEDEQFISRDDVVEAVQICLTHDATIGRTVELYQGDTPIPAALIA